MKIENTTNEVMVKNQENTRAGSFIAQHTDADGNYRTPLLPGFVLHVPTLWESELPDAVQMVDLVKAMLGG